MISNNYRYLIHRNGKKLQKIPTFGFDNYSTIYMPTISTTLSPTLSTISPTLSPTLIPGLYPTGLPGLYPAGLHGLYSTGLPGTYINATTAAPTATTAAPTATTAAPTATTAAPTSTATAPPVTAVPVPVASPINYSLITPNITNIRHLTHPDQDPELRRKVVKHFYNELKEVYFLSKFQKLLKYVIVEENNKVRLVNSFNELQQNKNNNNNFSLRIKFITENIFSKYDLEVLISKLIAKYSMLYSEDEYNIHWYNAKNKHAGIIKKAMYKKIKYRLQKKVNF